MFCSFPDLVSLCNVICRKNRYSCKHTKMMPERYRDRKIPTQKLEFFCITWLELLRTKKHVWILIYIIFEHGSLCSRWSDFFRMCGKWLDWLIDWQLKARLLFSTLIVNVIGVRQIVSLCSLSSFYWFKLQGSNVHWGTWIKVFFFNLNHKL